MSDELSKRGERAIKEGTDKIMRDAQERIRKEKEANKPVCTISISVDSDDQELVDKIKNRVANFIKYAENRGMNLWESAGHDDVEIKIEE